jgi:uncharacterized protein YqeY
MSDTAGLKTRIQDDVKTAMRGGDKPRLETLRLITAAIKQREVDERIQLDDTAVLVVLDKMIKQRRESIDQFEKASRTDLVEKEKFELAIIQSYLPQQLSDAEINTMIQAAMAETGAATIKDMGKVMAILKPKMQGRTDISKVSGLIKAKLAP